MNQTPQLDNHDIPSAPLVEPQTEKISQERRMADRVFGYSCIAAVVITFGTLIWVSRSDLFGAGTIIPPMKETQIKVFKRPLPPKPKKIIKPPPPPPKQPPPKPQPHVIQHPHPTPPQPHRQQVSVHTTTNTHAVSNLSMPTAPPADSTAPAVPGDVTTPPAPLAPPTTPPGPPTPLPTPPAPPAVHYTPPAPPPPPPPVVHPHNYSNIFSQEAGPIGDYESPTVPGDVDPSTLSSTSITVSFEIDENGHASEPHITKSSGNSEVDDAVIEAVRRTKFQPAIQDHLKLRQPVEHTFSVGQ